MAWKERIKTLEEFPHLAVLSLFLSFLEYSVCFTTNGLTAFLGEELECSFNICLVVKATTATIYFNPMSMMSILNSLYTAQKKKKGFEGLPSAPFILNL